MNSKYFFIVLLLLGGGIIFGLTAKQKQGVSALGNSSQSNTTESSSLLAQSKTMGVVEVQLTPESVETGKEVVFDLSMNNHSVDLNYDYTKIVTLVDDQGNEYKPSQWTGNTSGHHVRGKLIFPTIQEKTNDLMVILDGVDNQKETFEWKL